MNVELTNDGYLKNLNDWSPEVAMWLAQQQDLELTEDHWEIINLIRDFYAEYNTSPAIRTLVKATADKLGKEKGNSVYLHKLFPNGPSKQATLIAGLPKPIRCI